MKNKDKLLNNNNDTLIYKNNNNIRFKRMDRRLKGGWLVFALSTLSMVSVGFSTWVITEPASGYGQLDVIADDVVALSPTFTNIEMFTYYKDGTIYDGYLSNKGDIFVKFKLDGVKQYLEKTSKNDIAIIASFKSVGTFNILSYASTSVQCTIKDDNYPLQSDVTNDKTNIVQCSFSSNNSVLTFSSPVSINTQNDSIYAGIVYHFDFSSTNFNSDIYANMSKVVFELSLEVAQ